MNQEKLLLIGEVAKRLSVNTSTVYSLIKKGELKALKFGRLKVREETLNNYIKELEEVNACGKSL